MLPVRIRPGTQIILLYAFIAQLAEQFICNEQVVGSIPTESSKYRGVEKWSSRKPHKLEIVKNGSNPTTATL